MELYDVRRLPENGDTIEEALEREWLTEALADAAGPEVPLEITAAGRATLSLDRVSDQHSDTPAVRIRGRASAHLKTECVRCLAELELHPEAELDLTLLPALPDPRAESAKPETKAPKGKHPKVELGPQELDEGSYEGFEIDLPNLVREALLLAIEMNPDCEDEAACAERTAVLLAKYRESSESGEGEIDPRWAGLAKFLLKNE